MKPLISVISECHSDNLGDQAIARSICEILQSSYRVSHASFGNIVKSSAEMTRECIAKPSKSVPLKVFNLVSGRIKAGIRWHILGDKEKFTEHFGTAIQESDLVILGGGQLIKNNVALFCNKLSLLHKLSNARAIPFMIVGVGVDKRMSNLNWHTVRNAIVGAKFIILRDNISHDRVGTAIDLSKDCAVVPDLAFALKNPNLDRNRVGRGIELAVNVMNFEAMMGDSDHVGKPGVDNLISGFCSIVKSAINDGSTITLFTTGSSDDLQAASHIRDRVLTKIGINLSIFHPSTLDDLLAFLVDVRNVIATRMHAGILAYISGCNPLCINWDDKVEGVWSALYQPDRVVGLEEIVRPDSGVAIATKLRKLAPASYQSIDELAETIHRNVLEPIDTILMLDTVN